MLMYNNMYQESKHHSSLLCLHSKATKAAALSFRSVACHPPFGVGGTIWSQRFLAFNIGSVVLDVKVFSSSGC